MTQEGSNFKRCYEDPWPPVRGDYLVGDPNAGVAVATLASPLFVLVGSHLPSYVGAAIYGQCKTENLGVEKIVANVISNSNIRYLIISGVESKGHLPGNTLLALHRNGIDEQGRIIGSKGAIPFIQNLQPEAIKRFQRQVELIDCIGLEDMEQIERLVSKYNLLAEPYPEEPFLVVRRKAVLQEILMGEGDLFFGGNVFMDTRAWQIAITG
jgi:tetrahydromethanopterin S-methyltransferase subunit A